MTKAEAIAAFRAGDPRDRFCVDGEPASGRPNLMVWRLSPTSDLYKRGKYQVPYRISESEYGSHLYETPEEALEELAKQGVTEFYECVRGGSF